MAVWGSGGFKVGAEGLGIRVWGLGFRERAEGAGGAGGAKGAEGAEGAERAEGVEGVEGVTPVLLWGRNAHRSPKPETLSLSDPILLNTWSAIYTMGPFWAPFKFL